MVLFYAMYTMPVHGLQCSESSSSNVKIVYDGQMLRWGAGGIARYFSEIISRLPQDSTPTVLGLDQSSHASLRHPNLRIVGRRSLRPRALRMLWWQKKYLGPAGVFHPTYYNLSPGLRYSDVKCPVVLTVYDLIYARYAELMENSEEVLKCMRQALERADHVVCISKATENDLLELYPLAAGKTSVIYLGSSFAPPSQLQPVANFERPTFLFVGGRAGYKNFAFLLRAFAQACQSHPGIRLAVVGSPLTPEELWQINFLGITDRLDCVSYPDDETLMRLYCGSVALLYPSRHEGFGIPALEAMACGTIAVTSNTTSLPEVVGNAGIMLDPADEDAWVDCMLLLAPGGGVREGIIEKGRKRVMQFSWARTAAQHLEIYKRLSGI